MSWTPSEQMEQRGQELAVVDKILNTQLALQDSSSILRGEKCWTAKDQGPKLKRSKCRVKVMHGLENCDTTPLQDKDADALLGILSGQF